MNKEKVLQAYEYAKEQYAALGVNTDEAIKKLDGIKSVFIAGRPMMSVVLKPPMPYWAAAVSGIPAIIPEKPVP